MIGDREFIVQGHRRYTYAQVVERANRLAAYLHSRGLGCKTERSDLAGHEVGQDLLGIYAYNGPEYVEAMLGVMAGPGRAVQRQLPVRQERASLPARRFRRHRTDLPRDVRAARRRREAASFRNLRVLIQIADESGNDLVHGAVDYESIVEVGHARYAARTSRPPTTCTCSTPAAPRACPRVCCGASTTSS